MSEKKREKKSESLEVRLPWSVKRAFMRETKRNGETASDAVRRFIDDYLEKAAQAENPSPFSAPLSEITMTVTNNPRKTFAMALSAAAAAFTIAALPSAADESGFDILDKNKDGVIQAEDIGEGADVLFSVLDKNGDNQITRDEFGDVKAKVIKTKSGDKTVVTRKISVVKVDATEKGIDDPDLAAKIVKQIDIRSFSDEPMSDAEMQALIEEALAEEAAKEN